MKQRIFVFGSNLAGRHGKGAALHAKQHHGAILGQGRGRQGSSYAIPTKDADLNPLPLEQIAAEVAMFLEDARQTPDELYEVTPIGCGLAGYTPQQIAPMFRGAPANCRLPDPFRAVLFRPADYAYMLPEDQWETDRALGLLDWDGNTSTYTYP